MTAKGFINLVRPQACAPRTPSQPHRILKEFQNMRLVNRPTSKWLRGRWARWSLGMTLWMQQLWQCQDQTDWCRCPQATAELPGQNASTGSESSLQRMLSSWSGTVLALCNLLLDTQLESLSHGRIQRRVGRHLLAHPSWVIVLIHDN